MQRIISNKVTLPPIRLITPKLIKKPEVDDCFDDRISRRFVVGDRTSSVLFMMPELWCKAKLGDELKDKDQLSTW